MCPFGPPGTIPGILYAKRALESMPTPHEKVSDVIMLLMLSFLYRQFPIALRAFGMFFIFVVLLPRVVAQDPQASAQDPPLPKLEPLKFCSLGGPFVDIPSASFTTIQQRPRPSSGHAGLTITSGPVTSFCKECAFRPPSHQDQITPVCATASALRQRPILHGGLDQP
jgi:hypothetical protein